MPVNTPKSSPDLILGTALLSGQVGLKGVASSAAASPRIRPEFGYGAAGPATGTRSPAAATGGPAESATGPPAHPPPRTVRPGKSVAARRALVAAT